MSARIFCRRPHLSATPVNSRLHVLRRPTSSSKSQATRKPATRRRRRGLLGDFSHFSQHSLQAHTAVKGARTTPTNDLHEPSSSIAHQFKRRSDRNKTQHNRQLKAEQPSSSPVPPLVPHLPHELYSFIIPYLRQSKNMRRPATLLLTMAAAVSFSSPSVDAMAFTVPRRNKPVSSSTPAVDGVARTALYARSRKSSPAADDTATVSRSTPPVPTPTRSKIDTSSFGRDDDLDSYKAEMLNLVYHRSMQRAGLE